MWFLDETDATATLNEVVWRALSQDGAAAIHEWRLEQGNPRQPIGFHKLAGDVQGGGILYLVRTGSENKPVDNTGTGGPEPQLQAPGTEN